MGWEGAYCKDCYARVHATTFFNPNYRWPWHDKNPLLPVAGWRANHKTWCRLKELEGNFR